MPIQGLTYAVAEEADFSAQNIRVINGTFVYDLKYKNELFPNFELQMPGRHNIENALAATAMAMPIDSVLSKSSMESKHLKV